MKRKHYEDLATKHVTEEIQHKINNLNERKVSMAEAYKIYTDVMSGNSTSKFKGDRYD